MTVVPFNQLNPPPLSRYTLVTGDAVQDFPPLEWRVKDVLPASGLAAIYGPPSSGKSFLALDMAAAIADGGTWFGHAVKPAPVVYVALEGERGFPKRVKAWTQHNSRVCPADLYFVLDTFKLSSPADVDELAAVCPKGCVLIIDTLNRASPALDENSSRDMSTVLSACKTLARLTEGLVLLIHHTGKDETRGLRGHSSLLAALDASIEVSRSLDQRAWTVAKSKDDSDEVWHGFRLAVELVGYDTDGDAITSCAIEALGPIKTACTAQPQGKVQKLALAPIQALLATQGKTEMPGVPENVSSVPLYLAVDAVAQQLTEVEPKRRSNRAREAIEGMVKRGVLNASSDGMYIWIS